jgi:aminoglycoside phosphotransferase
MKLPRRSAELLTVVAFHILTRSCARRVMRNTSRVVLVSNLCIKSTTFTSLAEAMTMEFVSEHTDVPVPKVHLAFEHKNQTYIVMERLPGQNLSVDWLQRTEESRARILNQLRVAAQQIRNIPPPGGTGVSNTCGGPICDQRLPRHARWGPYESVHDFHRALRNGIGIDHLREGHDWSELQRLILLHENSEKAPVFTHGDLSSFNILADGDKLTGIVDWETAGWLPSYWEYTSACDANPQNQFWMHEVDKFLLPQPDALEMEKIRKRYFGSY